MKAVLAAFGLAISATAAHAAAGVMLSVSNFQASLIDTDPSDGLPASMTGATFADIHGLVVDSTRSGKGLLSGELGSGTLLRFSFDYSYMLFYEDREAAFAELIWTFVTSSPLSGPRTLETHDRIAADYSDFYYDGSYHSKTRSGSLWFEIERYPYAPGEFHIAYGTDIMSVDGYPLPVPEPSTWGLLSVGIASICLWANRRRRRHAEDGLQSHRT